MDSQDAIEILEQAIKDKRRVAAMFKRSTKRWARKIARSGGPREARMYQNWHDEDLDMATQYSNMADLLTVALEALREREG